MSSLAIRGSKGSSSTHTPVESPDSLINTSYANILDAISEGPIVGLVNGAQSIYFDQTPLANADGSLNFTGVTWEQRTGEAEQDYISGFPAVEAETSVGIELKASQPWTQALSNIQLSAVRIRLGASSLYQTDSDGDTGGYTVEYAVDLATDGGDYATVLSTSFVGKTTSGYQRSHRIELPKATMGWQIRVRRITADSTTSSIVATTTVISYTEVIDAKLQYPYTALVGVKVDASQFSAIPERAYRIRGRTIQVPANYDPSTRAYNGTWDGTFKIAWTDNPAWIYRDLVLNDRYGLGRYISDSQVDKWGLYQIAQYCDVLVSDGKGGTEPRFTCNLYLQSQSDALSVLQDMASIFRGMSYYAASEVVVSADMPSDPVYTYTNSNVVNGKFSRAGSSGSTRYSVCKVAWSDRDNFGNVRTEYVQDQKSLARYGIRDTSITAFGCVSQGQAQRLGQYTILTNQLETDTISFSVGLDGTIARPGQIVRVADENFAGRPIGGRIKAATINSVTLDSDAQVAAGDTLVIILPNGTAQTRVVRSVAGRVITVTQAFSSAPVVESIYAIETAELVPEVYRILTVAENFGDDKLQYDIVAVQHNASKFAAIDTGAKIVYPPTTVLPGAVQAIPTNVQLSTYDAVKQGLSVATMRVTWDAPKGAASYNVWWRRNSGDWVYAGVTYTNAIEVAGIYAGTYTARVSAVGVTGNSSLWGYSEPTDLQGKTGMPPALASITTVSEIWGIRLNWEFPASGAEDTLYTEIQESAVSTGDNPTQLGLISYPAKTYLKSGMAAGVTLFYRARLSDRIGNTGPWTAWVMGQSSSDASAILEYIAGQIDETALAQGLKDRIDLIDGPPGLPGSVNDRLNDLGTQVTEVTNQLQDQIDAIGDIADSAAYDPTKTYTVGQSVLAPDGKLYQAKGNVPANASPPNTTYWTDVGQAVTDANGLAARVTTTETRLTSVEGVNTSQASQIDGLQSSLSGKADASAVNSLTTRVTDAENDISSQGTAITGLQNSMANKADASTVASLSNTVTQQGNTLTAQGTQLTSINATVTGVSQDNYVKDPTYAAGKAGFSNANVTIVDRTDSTVAANAPAARLAKWAAPTSTGNTYVRFTPQDNRLSNNAAGVQPLISAAPGEVYYFSADVFVESTRQVGLWIQPYTDGTQVGSAWLLPTSTSVSTAATANTWAKLSGKHTVAAGINGLAISIRVSSGDAVNVWVANLRWTKETVEQAGAAAATSALDARVTQTEAGLTSQGSQITSLTNSLAGKADNSALQALASTVSQQGSTLDSQGSAVTQLQSTISGIAGAGTNLLPDDYSWLTSTTLPATIVNTLTRVGVAVAAAASGFGIKMTLGSAVTTQFLMLAPTNNAAGYNIDMEAGNYLVSMYVQGSAAGTMRVSMYNGSHRYSANVAYTTTRQRLTFVCTATAFARAAITIYPNMSALAAGTEITIDSVMIEEQVGTGTTPSAFVAGPSARAIAAQATAISTLDTRVTQTETTITAQASRLDGLYVQINPATAGDSTTYAGSASVFAGVWSEQSARIEDGIATAQRVDTVQASVTDTTNALVQTNASVQQTSQAVATLDGKVSASWSVKLQVNANGQYVVAGIGVGIENTGAGLQSQVLVSADRFAIVGTLAGGTSYTPFVVQGGQVFMNSAFIQDGTITNAKIGNYIQSNNFVAGSTGWRLYFDGTFEINSALGGGGRQVINGAGGKVFDASGVKRYQWGNLDA